MNRIGEVGTAARPAATRARPSARRRRATRLVAVLAAVVAMAGAVGGAGTTTPAGASVRGDEQPDQHDIAGLFDIGGRSLYLECAGRGSPTVVLISGGGIAGDLWDSPLGEQPTVFPTIAETTRVCTYDRPGTTRARAEGGVSRSDPIPQPVTPSVSVAELHALLAVAGETGPFVLAAHSYGGLVARLFANQHPDEVAGMVLVDSFSPELREAMPDHWASWIAWNTTPPEIIEDYPDYERVDFDPALDEVVANRAIPPMPLVVLTADKPYPAPTQPGLPADIHLVTRAAQDVSQREVARLVPGATHVTDTDSGHDIMLENPVVVSEAILDVVAAVREGLTSIPRPDVSGAVELADGRQVYVECRGQGSPTVVLIAGKGNGAEDWLQVLDPDSPIHDTPGDDLPFGLGELVRSDDAVLPSVARFTRVCAYDRPDIRIGSADVTTPREQPHTVDLDVADLRALLAALGDPGPYVLVPHSYGGLIAALYARTYPQDVAGLVMVDTVTQLMEDVVTPAKLANWDESNAMTSPEVREGVRLIDAFARINAAPPLQDLPAIVLSADKPWRIDLLPPELVTEDMVTFEDWLASLELLAADLGAEHITETHSGHDIYLYNPALVVEAIRRVVEPPPGEEAPQLTPVVQSVLSPPRWYPGDDGRTHLQYELLLTNTVPLPVDITEVEVRGDGRPVRALSGAELQAALSPLGSETGTTTQLAPSSVAVVWVDLAFGSPAEVPGEVSHRLTVDLGPGLPIEPVITSTGGVAQVADEAPTVIAPPLRGGRWVAAGGAAGPHRRALQALNGQLRLGQRFAVDFAALLEDDGRSHVGPGDQNASYFAYGQEVLAVGDGTVVRAVDGLADQVPFANEPVPLAEGGGNEVILQLDSGAYVAYGHLVPGSVRVEVGQRVATGDVVGLLGNSGASTGPHLHLQLMDGPSILAADGLPFVIDGFHLDGTVPSLEELVEADEAGTPMPIDPAGSGDRSGAGITGLGVVTFPG